MAQGQSREHLISALVTQVQVLALASDRIGAAYASQHHLHTTDFRALAAIYRAERAGQPLTARQLADELRVSPGAVTYLVDRLTASGHVHRDPDPDDRRRVLLRFGEHGRQVAGAFFGPLGQAHAEAMASYSETDLATCLRFLSDVNASLAHFHHGLTEGAAEADPPPTE
ncbi:MAG: MarR family winged helix-turn-helix transcriptional regulator [Propionibacteriaceae bacterium]|nr:MarR family winged helix-turn-helix transcriptional regulator [Propionibacteriaceae bacterium]